MRNRIKQILPKQVLEIYKFLRYIFIVTLFHICHLFPIHKTRVVICNVWGFGDNAKYIAEELVKRKNAHRKLDIIFITNHPENANAPQGITVLKTNTPKAVYALATARIWVDNNRKENYIRKRKGQYYIQTWHGGISLKKIEKDYEYRLGHKYTFNARRDSAMTDLYVSNSNFCTEMYRRSFWYKGEILECGSPRNDILLNPADSVKKEVRQRLAIKDEVQIAIYAPTYREGVNNTKPYELDFSRLLKVLEDRFGGRWVIAVRLHPLVSGQSGFIHYNSQIINASHYRDIYELMTAGDILITDYSNLMFEFSFMKKPVFLYAYDMEEYERERGFYFEYNNLPYKKARTESELIENMKSFENTKYQKDVDGFLNKLTLYETGKASECVVNRIMETIKKDK